MDLSELKKLIDDQGRAWQEFRRANDELIKAKADGKAVGDLEAKVATLTAAMDKADERKEIIERVDQIEALVKRANFGTGGKKDDDISTEVKTFNHYRASRAAPGSRVVDLSVDEFAQYKTAFDKYARKSAQLLSPDEMKALSAGSDPDGGYFLPPATTGRIIAKLYEMSPMRQIAGQMSISGDRVEGLIDNDEADCGWVTEQGTRSTTSTPQVGRWQVDAHEQYANPKVTQRILDDAATDVEAWLAGKVTSKFARVEGAAFVTGNGQGKPRGLFDYPSAATADGSRAWGTFEHVKSGANGAFLTNGTGADCLIDLQTAFKTGYLSNARWYTNRAVVALLRKMKEATTNAYLWQPGLTAGAPNMLLGYPVTIDQEVPTLTTGSNSMAFGDFREAYLIVDRIGIRTLRDPYTDKPFVQFYSTRRVGGGAVHFESVKFINFAA